MESCPRCGRTVPTTRPTCLYCGAPLPDPDGSSRHSRDGTDPQNEAPPETNRSLVILDPSGQEPDRLAAGLGCTLLDAWQLTRRGSYHLLKIATEAEAVEEQARLGGASLPVILVPESEVLASSRPACVLGGSATEGGLALRTAEGVAAIVAAEVLLVVHGPIARQYQTSWEVKRVRSAGLEEGYRFHLHLKSSRRPLEMDPGAFEFGMLVLPVSSLLQLMTWVTSLGTGVPVDDTFRRLPPALGPAQHALPGIVGAARSLSRSASRGEETPLVLDNVPQFRFYSSWRAAVERRAAPGLPRLLDLASSLRVLRHQTPRRE